MIIFFVGLSATIWLLEQSNNCCTNERRQRCRQIQINAQTPKQYANTCNRHVQRSDPMFYDETPMWWKRHYHWRDEKNWQWFLSEERELDLLCGLMVSFAELETPELYHYSSILFITKKYLFQNSSRLEKIASRHSNSIRKRYVVNVKSNSW